MRYEQYVEDPVGFYTTEMQVKMPRSCNCLLRSLLRTGRMGVSGKVYPQMEIRLLEIVVAVWRLLTHPNDDVMFAMPDGKCWSLWLQDASRLLAYGRLDLQKELNVSHLGIIHRGDGFGKVWCFLGKGNTDIPEPRGACSTLIISDINSASTLTIGEGCKRFAPPRLIVTTDYALV